MRALYIPGLEDNETILVEGKLAHHFLNVLRLKINTKVLGLDGKGCQYQLEIIEVHKKSLEFAISGKQFKQKTHEIVLAVGKVKKEALDLIIKQSCELGISEINILETEFSQRYSLNHDRLNKLLIAGIEQSNNPFLPVINEITLDNFDLSSFTNTIYFSSIKKTQKNVKLLSGKTLLVLGPEGGFSLEEEMLLEKITNSLTLNLDTYIMRTPTAVACGVGFYLGALG